MHACQKAPEENAEDTPPPTLGRRIPRGRGRCLGWKLLAAWVLAPLLLLGTAELALRLAGFGVSTRLFVSREVGGETLKVTNRAFFQQFYTMPIVWAPHEFSLPARKAPDTYRVFVFGESAAEGVPDPDFAFWRILGTMLRASPCGRKVEIYNLAIAGANSHVMREAARACSACQPDLYLVYMGNNELNPSVTQRLVWDRLPPWLSLRLLHLTVALNDLRLVQWLQGIRGPGDLDQPRGNWGEVRDPERAYRYFESNLNDICSYASGAGARVILCTVGSRLRAWEPQGTRPDSLSPRDAEEWDAAWGAGNELRGSGRDAEALNQYLRAWAIDKSNGRLAYAVACLLEQQQKYGDAESWYVRARELDRIRFRPKNRINEIIRGTARARGGGGVVLADAERALSDASPHGIEGPECFLDQVHLTFEGNHVLAQCVLGELGREKALFSEAPSPLSLEECRVRLAMTPADLRDQLERTEKSDETIGGQLKDALARAIAGIDRQTAGRNADDLRLDACQQALALDPGDEIVRTRYVQLLMRKGSVADALEQAKALTADFPHSCLAHRLLAQLYSMNGDTAHALATLGLVLEWNPDDAETLLGMGQCLLGQKQPQAALSAFQRSYDIGASPYALRCVGRAQARLGRFTEAISTFRQCRQLEPDNPDLFSEFVGILCEAGYRKEAEEEAARWKEGKGSLPRQLLEVLENSEPFKSP